MCPVLLPVSMVPLDDNLAGETAIFNQTLIYCCATMLAWLWLKEWVGRCVAFSSLFCWGVWLTLIVCMYSPSIKLPPMAFSFAWSKSLERHKHRGVTVTWSFNWNRCTGTPLQHRRRWLVDYTKSGKFECFFWLFLNNGVWMTIFIFIRMVHTFSPISNISNRLLYRYTGEKTHLVTVISQ